VDPRDRVVLITGASSGIGAATARLFAHYGAKLVLAARSADKLQQLAAGLASQALVVPCDVSQPEAVKQLIEATIAHYQRIDILINNAGVGLAGPIAQLDPSDLERAFAVDLFGPLYTIQAALPHMQRQGAGQIINVSSVVALRALPYLGGYAAAKAALERLTEALRTELYDSPIAVSLVRPGTTETSFSSQRLGKGSEQRRVSNKGVSPEVVAQTILRTARREPLVSYVTWRDRLQVLLAAVAPRITDRLLANSFAWQERQD
jgi:Short-chain dehydrogenases of various substrate specificities